MRKYEVGNYFYEGPKRLNEGLRLHYDEGGFLLQVCLNNITEKESLKLKKDRAEFALFEKNDILFFLARFPGVIDWSDAPFHIGLYNKHFDLPEIGEGQGLSLNVFGLDSTNGKIKAMRLIGLGTNFSRKLIDLLKEQQQQQVKKAEYFIKIESIYNELTCDMMAERAIIKYKTRGGDNE